MRSICPNNASNTTACCAIRSPGLEESIRIGSARSAHPDTASTQVVDQVQGVAHSARAAPHRDYQAQTATERANVTLRQLITTL